MLSRVADSLYWMSRYLERAEHTARVIDINLHGGLDHRPESAQRHWEHILKSLQVAHVVSATRDPAVISHQLTLDGDLTNSVISCVQSARRNAREVREQISVEMWEQINRMHLMMVNAERDGVWDRDTQKFLIMVLEGAHLFRGLADATMSHSEGWHFIQLGRFLERVNNTVNLLDAHFVALQTEPGASPVDNYLEWVSLLKSCAVFGAYCRVYTANVQPATVAEFLLLDADSPQSVRFGADKIGHALNSIADSANLSRRSGIFRIVGRLTSTLSYDEIGDVMRQDLHAYLSDIREQCAAIHTEIYDACITYPVETAPVST